MIENCQFLKILRSAHVSEKSTDIIFLLFLFSPKALESNLISTKEEFMKLRQVLRHLRHTCTDGDDVCLLRTTSALWDKWLSLLEAAKEWEIWCEELKQEWKFVNEEVSASFSTI